MKVCKLFILLYLTMFLSGCAATDFDSTIKIVPPQNKNIPLEGNWKVVKTYKKDLKSKAKDLSGFWVGKSAGFSQAGVLLGDYFWTEPGYKVKKVNSEEYLLYYAGDAIKNLKMDNKEIDVVTITSEDKFLYEFVKLKDKEMLVNVDGTILLLDKVSNTVNAEFTKRLSSEQISIAPDIITDSATDYIHSGVVLGIRSNKNLKPKKSGVGTDEYTYKTFWIANDQRGLHPILKTDNILLPRKNGFWKVSVKRTSDDNGKKDTLLSNAFSMEYLKGGASLNSNNKELEEPKGNVFIKILFAGNDFLSLEGVNEKKSVYNSAGFSDNRLWLQPVDNLSNEDGLKIVDIAGETGVSAFERARSTAVLEGRNNQIMESDMNFDDSNFGLFRRNGHWIFRGRYTYTVGKNKKPVDMNLNLIPPSKLVAYDTLWVTWTQVKDKVPNAIDVFTSPGKNIAIIQTEDTLLIFALENGILGDLPMKKISIKVGDSIVMAEWATGDYVEKWERVLLMSGAKEIK